MNDDDVHDVIIHYDGMNQEKPPRYSTMTKSPVFPILLVNFIGILGISVVIPILIFIVTDFGGNGFVYGLLGATYPFFQFIGAPILGRLSDRIGRKRVLIVSQAGTFLSWSLFLTAFFLPITELWNQNTVVTGSYSMTLPLLVIFVARMFDGFTGGNISVANAYMSDISTDADRSENFGKMGASSSMGFVIGPAFAGILAGTILGEILPVIIASLISLVAIFIIVYRLKESNPCIVDTSLLTIKGFRQFFQAGHKPCYTEGKVTMETESNDGWKSVIQIKGIPTLYVIYFMTFLAFSLFYAGWPVYVSSQLGWSTIQLGAFLAYFSLVMVLVQGPGLKKLSPKIPGRQLVLWGSCLLSLGFALLTTGYELMLYVAATIMALGNGIMWPSFMAALSKAGTSDAQGSIQGYGSSMGSIASILGLVLGGFLVQGLGLWVFLIAAILFLIIAIFTSQVKEVSS